MYIFISHSSFNAKVALELCAALEKEGHQCFLAPRDIRPGHEYAEEIINGIDRSDSMIVLLSDQSNQRMASFFPLAFLPLVFVVHRQSFLLPL